MKIYIDSESLFEEYLDLPEKIAELVLKYNLNKQDVLNCFLIYWNRYVNDNDLAYIIHNECLTVAYREANKFVYENIEECVLKNVKENININECFHNYIDDLLVKGVVIEENDVKYYPGPYEVEYLCEHFHIMPDVVQEYMDKYIFTGYYKKSDASLEKYISEYIEVKKV